MLLPEVEMQMARDHIKDLVREAEVRKHFKEMECELEQAAPKHTERNWLRQLFLGKAGV